MVEERLAWVTLRLIAPGVQARSGRPLCSWHCCADDDDDGRVGVTDATTGGGVLVVLVLEHATADIATVTARSKVSMQASLRGGRGAHARGTCFRRSDHL